MYLHFRITNIIVTFIITHTMHMYKAGISES